MKRNLLATTVLYILFLAACQPDETITPNTPGTSTQFVGSWNRDSVLVNLINSSGVKTRSETNPNDGFYTFYANETGLLTTNGGTEFAVTYFYDNDQQKITITEQDWPNQSYTVQNLGNSKYLLTGIKFVADNNKLERIIYLSKKMQ